MISRNKLNDSEQKRKSEIKTLQDQIDRYKGSIRKLIEYDLILSLFYYIYGWFTHYFHQGIW